MRKKIHDRALGALDPSPLRVGMSGIRLEASDVDHESSLIVSLRDRQIQKSKLKPRESRQVSYPCNYGITAIDCPPDPKTDKYRAASL